MNRLISLSKYNINKIIDEFKLKQIDFSYPGFYDDSNFIINERQNEKYLNLYAKFIRQTDFPEEYVLMSKNKINDITKYFFTLLNKERNKGICIDASLCLSRILEKEGIWNYITKGSLTIEFPNELDIEPLFFWSIDEDNPNIQTGHSWIVAPPYEIIDITLKFQYYKNGVEKYLPDFILSENSEIPKVRSGDIINIKEAEHLKLMGINDKEIFTRYFPDYFKFRNDFPPILINNNGIKLKYIACGIAAPNEKLEEMKSKFYNMNPSQIYQEIKMKI
jgi:hypothetical protein